MKPAPGTARILVATDNVDDAQQILRQLHGDFDHVKASTNPALTTQEFEEYRPDVLVLAFDSLDKAQRYYLGLYRLGQAVQQHTHRTVILCSKDEVREVFDLCKKQYFDDYVLYWPHTHDGPRLAMSIWIACREMAAMKFDALRPAELLAHAKHVGDLERMVGHELADGEQRLSDARRSFLQSEHEIAAAIDDFSHRLVDSTAASWIEVKDKATLAQEIDRLKQQQIAQTRRVGTDSVRSMIEWAGRFKARVEPAFASTRTLTDKVRKVRPIVMVVDDDELARRLVSVMLDRKAYEVVFVGDGREALIQLRRMRPDVVLMDIGLPGQDGVALTQRLKASPHLADIPIIMMTGDARRATLVSSMEAGAIAFVVKPFTRESLNSNLDKVLPR
jgi:CheY-like chemotaxis protein